MREFHMSYSQAMAFPINVAFGLVAWHCESHPWVKFERQSPGYVAQAAAVQSPKSNVQRPKSRV